MGGRQYEDTPIVSVIVPAYNEERFIRRAIESVVNQTYTGRYEVLLIDDGSTDGTATICKEYVDRYPFVHYYYHDNEGLAKTREKAVKLAKGKYLCWIDADDYVSPDLLKITMQKLEEAEADICAFSWQLRFANGKEENHFAKEYSVNGWQKQTITAGIANVWSYISKKELWEHEEFPWQVIRCAEDAYITPILFHKARKITSVPAILYFQEEVNPYSITHTYSGKRLLGTGYTNYLRFKISQKDYPDIADNRGNVALKWLTRAYCASAYLEDLTEEQREEIRSYILDTAGNMSHIPLKHAYRIFVIRHRLETIVKFMGKMSCRKAEKENQKVRELMKK